MCNCDNGWRSIESPIMASDFCDCPDGDALKDEMNHVWKEYDEEGENHRTSAWIDAMQERLD